jgi:hypothetical protein
LLAAVGAAVFITAGAYFQAPDAHAALGGPVILGGDDLTDHGCNDGEGTNLAGWLYMQRALENIEPNVTRSNDGTIAALGSASVDGALICSDAGSAIYHAAQPLGLTVVYYDGGPAIEGFFADLASGAADPAIIWIAGTGASNNIEETAEADALTNNASDISDFVSEGGGLFAHGSEYGWLFALLPGASAVDSGGSGDLFFTPEGLSDLPALTVDDINAGPWHNHFEGDFGGLAVLVRSNGQGEGEGGGGFPNAAVILGGAQVTFEENPVEEPDATATPCIPPLVTYRCDGTSNGGGGGGNPDPTETPAAAQPTPAVSVAPATVVPSQPAPPVGIAAPDTGDGTATAGASELPVAYGVMLTLGAIAAGIGFARIAGKRRTR